jgi:hypothetical protein
METTTKMETIKETTTTTTNKMTCISSLIVLSMSMTMDSAISLDLTADLITTPFP